MCVSGRDMLGAIVRGVDDPAALAQLARGRMRSKIDELERALTGKVRASHRLLLRLHLEHIDDLNAKIEALNQEIDGLMLPFDQNDELRRLDDIPGVGKDVAQIIIAELGTDMERFPSAGHAASWAGLAPGKNESAGRNRSGKIRPGNKHLKRALVQAAHAASRTRDNYLAAQFRRLAARRGKKRAAVAVAHSILVIAYHMLHDGTEYRELGGDYFDQRNHDYLQLNLVKRLEKLGYTVSLEPATVAA
jgi:transposase